MESRNSASPSPPPQAPVASAPGPRAAALQKVFASALSTTIKTNSYANFSACFPTPAKFCPSALEDVWKQINTRFEYHCTREFENVIRERKVIEGLNQWDSVIEDARRRMNRGVEGEDPGRPPHTLSGQELYEAHLAPHLQVAGETLRERLSRSQSHNAEMMDKVTAQRMEIEGLVNGLEGIVKDIEGSVEAARAGGLDGLQNEMWQMEQEVQATR